MKQKIKYLAVFIVSVIFLTACGNNGVQTMTCTRTMNQNGIKTGLKYTVIYQGDYVTRVKSVETIETDSSEVLDAYQEQIESIYSPYKGIDYYEHDVSIDGDKLTSTVDINYEKIDTDKLLEIDSANGQLIKDGKIKLSDIKSVYEAIGAV